MSRCKLCNRVMSHEEMSRKKKAVDQYEDTCTSCLEEIERIEAEYSDIQFHQWEGERNGLKYPCYVQT